MLLTRAFFEVLPDCCLTVLSVWHSAGDCQHHGQLRARASLPRWNKWRRCNAWGLIKTVVLVSGVSFQMNMQSHSCIQKKTPTRADAHMRSISLMLSLSLALLWASLLYLWDRPQICCNTHAKPHAMVGSKFTWEISINLYKFKKRKGLGMRQAEERPVLLDFHQDSVWKAVVTG